MCPDTFLTYYIVLDMRLKRRKCRVVVVYREDINETIVIAENIAKYNKKENANYSCYIGALGSTTVLSVFDLVQNQKEVDAAELLRRHFGEIKSSIMVENIEWNNLWEILPKDWEIDKERLYGLIGLHETKAFCLGYMKTYYVALKIKYKRLYVFIGFRAKNKNTMVVISNCKKSSITTGERYSFYLNAIDYGVAEIIYNAVCNGNIEMAVSYFKENFNKEKAIKSVLESDRQRLLKSLPKEWRDDVAADDCIYIGYDYAVTGHFEVVKKCNEDCEIYYGSAGSVFG